jgi:hypothetical protein
MDKERILAGSQNRKHLLTKGGSTGRYVIFPNFPMVMCCKIGIRGTGPPQQTVSKSVGSSKAIDLLWDLWRRLRSRFSYGCYLSLVNGHVHRKVYLPTYGLFDEGRFFAWGDRISAFDTRFGRAGVLICEDFWHSSPPYLLWLDGADLFLFTSSSPGRGLTSAPALGSSHWVDRVLQAYSALFTSFVATNG